MAPRRVSSDATRAFGVNRIFEFNQKKASIPFSLGFQSWSALNRLTENTKIAISAQPEARPTSTFSGR
jgi:hypothetical protein